MTETGELSLRSGDYRCSVSAADLRAFADARPVVAGEPRQNRAAGAETTDLAALFATSDELARGRSSETRSEVRRMAAKDGSPSSLMLRDGLIAVSLDDEADGGWAAQRTSELRARIRSLVEEIYREALEQRCGPLPPPFAPPEPPER